MNYSFLTTTTVRSLLGLWYSVYYEISYASNLPTRTTGTAPNECRAQLEMKIERAGQPFFWGGGRGNDF